MKNLLRLEERLENVLTRFGSATLVQTGEGRFELRGGSPTDGIEAREWISLFMPEAVVRMKQNGAQTFHTARSLG